MADEKKGKKGNPFVDEFVTPWSEGAPKEDVSGDPLPPDFGVFKEGPRDPEGLMPPFGKK